MESNQSAPENPACPKCGSLRAFIGTTSSTAMGCVPFTDELGRSHHHDTNRKQESRTCLGCGASYTVTIKSACWCGWKQP